MQRFTKIKHNKDGVLLKFTTDTEDSKGVDRHEYTNVDKPHPDFVAALNAFRPFVAQLCDFPESYLSDATVASVSVSRGGKDGQRGCMIHAVRKVSKSNAPFNIHTPRVKEAAATDDEHENGEEDAPDDAVGLWLPGMDEALEELEAQAIKYIQGTREQGNLFEQPVTEHRRNGKPSEKPEPAGVH